MYGNKLFNRIPFEEWSVTAPPPGCSELILRRGLKSIPPLSARRQQQEISGKKIDIIYPPSLIPEQNVSKILHQLGTERNVIHRSRLTWSLIGMPIVAPFALVPVIPNLPFFYLAYRGISGPPRDL